MDRIQIYTTVVSGLLLFGAGVKAGSSPEPGNQILVAIMFVGLLAPIIGRVLGLV